MRIGCERRRFLGLAGVFRRRLEREVLREADSVILATARLHGATVWTQDADFQGIEGVRYIAETRG